MGFMKEKVARITGAGFATVFCWVLAKSLGGLGIGLLLATYFPRPPWLWIGWAIIVLSVLLGLPAAKAAWLKPKGPAAA